MTTKKKKAHRKPRLPKTNLMAGMPRPKPVKFRLSTQVLEQAREYPIVGCWITQGWQDQGLTPVVIARLMEEERVVFGVFLVDLFCLGVKDAFWRADVSLKQFHRDLPQHCAQQPEPCEVGMAHEIIYGAIEYAHRYGFEPHSDYKQASLLLDPPDTHPKKHKVAFGKDGKPFFVPGPNDNARFIVDQLMRTAGEGNFDYLIMFDEMEEL